ncbi:MAG: hypothetical protein FJ216_08730 [Ignavibacteria bacterium]|nr:hypothetical protein [Ignavibacteria bacterium]
MKWTSWALLQAFPSPFFVHDEGFNSSRLQFALKWNVTPFNYSFNANELVSPVSILMVNPIRRYGGSVELFLQPEWALSTYRNSGMKRFALNGGTRFYIPVSEGGEYLSVSLGVKYKFRKNLNGFEKNSTGLEFGVYTFFGIIGFQADYNFTSESRYNLGITIRYY